MKSIFVEMIGENNVLTDEPMKMHTTFRIGGTADYFLTPETEEQLTTLLKYLKSEKIPYFILGNGSNLLVGDKGIRGVVINLYKNMDKVEIDGECVYAQCGALLSKTASCAVREELTGFEFASGIPGTVGGAVYMNAGAYGFELKDVIESVRYIDSEGEIKEVSGKDERFGYRTSPFTGTDEVVVGCTFRLKKGNIEEIKELTRDFTNRRVTKQPLDKPSAGSVFKRPEGYFAGALIEEANLKGHTIGGAQVSEKHAGFIINTGDAAAKDVLDLIEYIKKTVFERSGVELEAEIRMVGEF